LRARGAPAGPGHRQYDDERGEQCWSFSHASH
jgi:hypothetical protein